MGDKVIIQQEIANIKSIKMLNTELITNLFIGPVFAFSLPSLGFINSLSAIIIYLAFFTFQSSMKRVSYTVLSEKVYKTFESLLSTPIDIKKMVIIKVTVPFIINLSIMVITLILFYVTQFLLINTVLVKVIDKFGLYHVLLLFSIIAIGFIIEIVTLYFGLKNSKPRNVLYIVSIACFLLLIPYIYILVFSNLKNVLSLILLLFSIVVLLVFTFKIRKIFDAGYLFEQSLK